MDAQHQCSTFDMTCKGFKPIQVSKSDAHLGFQNIGFRHFWGCFWFSVSLQCQWLQSGNCADHCTAPPSHCNFKANKTFQTLSFCIGIISAGTEGDIHMTHTRKDKNTGQQAQTQKTTEEETDDRQNWSTDKQTDWPLHKFCAVCITGLQHLGEFLIQSFHHCQDAPSHTVRWILQQVCFFQ